jgi:hypothetical protein
MEDDTNSVAFSQRLHEACKAKGVLELNRIQKEAASLSSQYQSCLPQEEINVRQREHLKYVTPLRVHSNNNDTNDIASLSSFYANKNASDDFYFNKNVEGIASDISSYLGLVNSEIMKYENIEMSNVGKPSSTIQQQSQKPPLQQQLMQHRLLQQKRQILQKQGALESAAGLSRRHSQMLRQQSYKAAQNQQILPPLPLSEKESEDLIAFQHIVENPDPSSSSSPSNFSSLINACGVGNGVGSGSIGSGAMKTSHLHNTSYISPSVSPQTVIFQGDGNLLPKNLHNAFQSCQISDQNTATTNLYHQVSLSLSSQHEILIRIFLLFVILESIIKFIACFLESTTVYIASNY